MPEPQMNMAKLLADTLRAKATSITTSTLTPLEWGSIYTHRISFGVKDVNFTQI
jgi:hypothetical protein